MSFTPSRRAERDSLTITARDISGNVATRTLAYRMGDKLAIRELGSYPNPFADTAVFVYSLTDYCDKVDLKVYSRAGRPVRGLAQRNVVGYQEVVWDGRSDDGGEVANGLYFLKITAKAGSSEAVKVYKLFKKKRR
jgi:flagellar hook assembly protein FlgD